VKEPLIIVVINGQSSLVASLLRLSLNPRSRKYFKNGSEHSSTFGSFVPLKRQGSIGRRNLAIFKTKVLSKL
jgi:hypothetical protein